MRIDEIDLIGKFLLKGSTGSEAQVLGMTSGEVGWIDGGAGSGSLQSVYNSGNEINGYKFRLDQSSGVINFSNVADGSFGTIDVIQMGSGAGNNNTGVDVIQIGSLAGSGNTGENAIQIGYAAGTNNAIRSSTDAIIWTSRTAAAGATIQSITFGNNLFVVSAQSSAV